MRNVVDIPEMSMIRKAQRGYRNPSDGAVREAAGFQASFMGSFWAANGGYKDAN